MRKRDDAGVRPSIEGGIQLRVVLNLVDHDILENLRLLGSIAAVRNPSHEVLCSIIKWVFIWILPSFHNTTNCVPVPVTTTVHALLLTWGGVQVSTPDGWMYRA